MGPRSSQRLGNPPATRSGAQARPAKAGAAHSGLHGLARFGSPARSHCSLARRRIAVQLVRPALNPPVPRSASNG